MKAQAAEERLRELGCSMTPQRRAILRFLDGNSGHPTASEVFAAVTRDFPQVSRATVYNTLALLESSGLVSLVRDASREGRYDPNITHHHHLVCPDCGRIQDIAADDVTLFFRGLPARAIVRVEEPCDACIPKSF